MRWLKKNPPNIRWLFLSVPLALLGAAWAAYKIPDIRFFEAWPALNIAFFLVGLAIVPALVPATTLRRRLIHIGIFAPLAAVFIAILIGASLDRYYGNDLEQTFYLRFRAMMVAGLSASLLYAAVAGAIVYLRAKRVNQTNLQLVREAQDLEQARKTEELSRQLTETRLRMLQAQIEPHFLFNTLASAQQLSKKGAPDAAKLIGELVRFLRISLPNLREQRAPLKTEFEQISAYLSIMQVRMGERLRFNVQNLDTVDPVGDFMLPPALVMTLVENAIKHGLEPSEFGGEITVLSELQGNQLHIVVRDTGVGFTSLESKDSGGGTGLSNITQRLQANYGDQASLELTSLQPHGCLALLKLPLHLISPQSI